MMQYRVTSDTDQYERWQRERGTAYAEQQLRYKRQWEQGRSTPPVAARSALEHLKADKQYNAHLERVLSGLEGDTTRLVDALGEMFVPNYAESKRLAIRDLADEEKQIRIEVAQAKAFKAARTKLGAVEGLVLVYNVVDTYGTRFHFGCLNRATPGSIKYYWEHNEGEFGNTGPIARVTALYEITRAELPEIVRLQHPEAKGGLICVREYFDTENGKAAHWWLMNGTRGISIGGLKTLRTTTREEDGRRVTDVYEAEISEISDGRMKGAVPGTMPFVGNSQGSLLEGKYKR